MDKKHLNEFRQNLVSGMWVLFATGRSKRPQKKADHQIDLSYRSKDNCPFEDPFKSGQKMIQSYPNEKEWKVIAIENKYPAVKPGICGSAGEAGPFKVHDSVGKHEVIIYKDHDKHFADFSAQEAEDVVRVYKERYRRILEENKGCLEYIMIFHNFGRQAGATIYHPHSQIISTPIMPPNVFSSVNGSQNFYLKNKKRVYDVLIDWELKEKKRIVYENDLFVAFCPFVSKFPYEIRIFSRDSHAHFEKMPDEFDKYFADALVKVLGKLKRALNDPPYNFFIHTAPVKETKENPHEFYHWHLEIKPYFKIDAGFEMGTGIDLNVIDPDEAAELFRQAG